MNPVLDLTVVAHARFPVHGHILRVGGDALTMGL